MFQPHHVGADGFVNRRLVRLASEGRIILSGPISSAEAEGAARYHYNMYPDDGRLPSSGTTSSSSSPDELARMIGCVQVLGGWNVGYYSTNNWIRGKP